jgi:hypothetical protein
MRRIDRPRRTEGLRKAIMWAATRMAVLVLTAFSLAGCITPLKYGPMAENHGLGYRDFPNADGSFTILVVAFDSATAQQFWDRRAQELCGDTHFHKNIFRAEVPVVRVSGYAPSAVNPGYGGAYSEDQHGSFYLEGYLRCGGDAASTTVQPSPASDAAAQPPAPAVTP